MPNRYKQRQLQPKTQHKNHIELRQTNNSCFATVFSKNKMKHVRWIQAKFVIVFFCSRFFLRRKNMKIWYFFTHVGIVFDVVFESLWYWIYSSADGRYALKVVHIWMTRASNDSFGHSPHCYWIYPIQINNIGWVLLDAPRPG